MFAGSGDSRVKLRPFAREGQQPAGDAVGSTLRQELRCFRPSIIRGYGPISKRFVGEEGKHAIFDDRPSNAAAVLVETAGISLVSSGSKTKIPLEGIQSRAVDLEKEAAVVFVGSILRYHFDLRAVATTKLRVVRIGSDADFLDGLLVRCDDGGAAKIQTVY